MTAKKMHVAGVEYTEYRITEPNPASKGIKFGIIIFRDNTSNCFAVVEARNLRRVMGSLLASVATKDYTHTVPKILKDRYPVDLFDNITIYYREFEESKPAGHLKDICLSGTPSKAVVMLNLVGSWLDKEKEAKKVHSLNNYFSKYMDTRRGGTFIEYLCPDIRDRMETVEQRIREGV